MKLFEIMLSPFWSFVRKFEALEISRNSSFVSRNKKTDTKAQRTQQPGRLKLNFTSGKSSQKIL